MTKSEQVKRLRKAISTCSNSYDKLLLLDALRSEHIREGAIASSEDVAAEFIAEATIVVRMSSITLEQKENILSKLLDSYITRAPNDFHAFLLALEWERPVTERFYQPRMRVLQPIVGHMTDMMVHDKYDMMMLSMPPGTGKSTLGIFFLTWVIGRKPEKCNLAVGYSSPMANSFFKRVMGVDEDPEYLYHKIFPNLYRIATNSKEFKLDFAKTQDAVEKPFVSLRCASIAGSLTGVGRCEEILYCDDLVEGAETAMSPLRLEKLWSLYTDNARSRKKDGCKELHIGTRWSLHDPIGRLQALYQDNDRCKIISLPALDENDESLFNYDYGVGFSTEAFHDIRLTQSSIGWAALYKQEPIEAEGLLFPVDSLKRFKKDDIDLEHNPPDDIFAFCDVAFGGNDYLAMPIMAQWGTDNPFVIDVVFMKGSYQVTQPIVAGKLAQCGVKRAIFESNNGGDFYAKDIRNALDAMGVHCRVDSQHSGTAMSKSARIIQHSPAILGFSYLRQDDYDESNHYKLFMQNLITYNGSGSNENDDAPDSLAGVSTMLRKNTTAKLKMFSRKFL